MSLITKVCLFHQQIVCFGVVDCTGEASLLQALSTSLTTVYIPALELNSNWGELSKSPQGLAAKDEFMKYTEGFVDYLNCKWWPHTNLSSYDKSEVYQNQELIKNACSLRILFCRTCLITPFLRS